MICQLRGYSPLFVVPFAESPVRCIHQSPNNCEVNPRARLAIASSIADPLVMAIAPEVSSSILHAIPHSVQKGGTFPDCQTR